MKNNLENLEVLLDSGERPRKHQIRSNIKAGIGVIVLLVFAAFMATLVYTALSSPKARIVHDPIPSNRVVVITTGHTFTPVP